MATLKAQGCSFHAHIARPLSLTCKAFRLLLLLGALLAGFAPIPAWAFNIGDVMAGTDAGQTKRFSPGGTLLQTLDSGSGSVTTGMCFDGSGNLFATQFSTSSVAKFNAAGALVTYPFGSGFNADPESCVVDTSGNLYFGQADGSQQILRFNAAGTPTGNFAVATGPLGSDWIELGPDQCTMYYTSEGSAVKRFDVCTNTQLPDFATGLPDPECFALRLRPNGDLMVACSSGVLRLDSTGTTLQTYPASGFTPAANFLFTMSLDPDGSTFWAGDVFSGQVYRINIGSGTQVTSFNVGLPPGGELGGLAVVGEITGSGGATTGIPTLSEWAQIGMVALLVGGGLLALRKKGQVV